MKVSELLEVLSGVDPELTVFFNDNEYGPSEVSGVRVTRFTMLRMVETTYEDGIPGLLIE